MLVFGRMVASVPRPHQLVVMTATAVLRDWQLEQRAQPRAVRVATSHRLVPSGAVQAAAHPSR